MNKTFSPDSLGAIDDTRERQSAAIDAFNRAMEEEDYDTAREICDAVIGRDTCANSFGAGFQMHCLRWLTGHYHRRYVGSEEGSVEEETALEGLWHCIWVCKWIIARLPLDLTVTAAEIEEANDFMGKLYRDFSLSAAAVSKTLMHQSILTGDARAAQRHFQDWQDTDADDGGDCEACEQNSLIEYSHFTGDYAEAVRLAEPILSGSLSCGEVPHLTYRCVIDSLIALGRRREASALLERAEEHIGSEGEAFHFLLAPLASLHRRLDEPEAASALLDEHSGHMVNAAQNNALYYLEYLSAVAPFNEDAHRAARELAAQFDERNGNSHRQNMLERLFAPQVLH